LTPNRSERVNFQWGEFAGYILITVLFFLARSKYTRLHDVLCPLLVANICWFNFSYMPFNPSFPREYVFWAIILIFRCSIVTTLFQLNGSYDLAWTFLVSMATIIGRANLIDRENSYWLIMPVFTAIIGCTAYNGIIAREQRYLFLMEKTSKRQQHQHLELINLLPGGVLILNKTYDTILFKNNQIGSDEDWIT